MAETQIGAVALVWGAPSGTTFKRNGSLVAYRMTEISLDKECDLELTRDEIGDVVNATGYNQNQRVQLTVWPSGGNRAAAAAIVTPDPMDRLAIITANDAETGAADPGREYMVERATKSRSQTGKVTIQMVLRRWSGISSYSALA